MASQLSDVEVYAMVDSLEYVGPALSRANPEKMAKLYEMPRLETIYPPTSERWT